ncbi:hypothetical protein J23TS9_46380 [Paenibacillus sp. J23TS9]|uniref:hypothetical protein n=1 Tax=Paenibacillus sp. J23TS9 TaxID=2807193 RepID=UPI001B02912F|nr:hypothetical protein [Paenibacillus sp. J23TS9]GIP29508.1 hypothetical protein J23TS9_46380 [Paenibacillus sp. J23TS9]
MQRDENPQKRVRTKIMSFALVLSLSLSLAIPAFAERDPYSAIGKYVQELVDLDNEQIKALSIEEADVLFEKAYTVQAEDLPKMKSVMDWTA